MNRLIIIGNGFDLAHGLPTGYCDFIDDYWGKVITPDYHGFVVQGYIRYDDNLIALNLNFTCFDYYFRSGLLNEFENLNSYSSIKEFVMKHVSAYNLNYDDIFKVNYKNDFFKIVNELHSAKNWVDIENIYYEILKTIAGVGDNKYKGNIDQLNREFEEVKCLLENYLNNEVIDKYEFNLEDNNSIIKIFHPGKIDDDKMTDFLDEFPVEDEEEARNNINMITNNGKNDFGLNLSESVTYNITFLNFNYTPVSGVYINELKKRWSNSGIINIHGMLNDIENPIIFGFGDEMDEDYKKIENINNNEFLKNIKSFQYLNNSNYRRLIEFLDHYGKFQLYIMGHSCGLSDRILLNTIFEHNNCRSIKVFYHQKENGSDNYTEIIQNISRHFNKKKLMREKIVNKTLCQPMPQIKLPKKEL